MRTLVIGYGSPIRGDDAVGPMLADQIQHAVESGDWPPGTEVQSRHILTAELVADIERAERVIFLDAAANLSPGEIRHRKLTPDAAAPSTMAHFHDPRELLAWCEALYGSAPDAWIITVGGGHWGYGHFELSAPVNAALPAAIDTARQLCEFSPTVSIA
jgi:hydrogenase maturation protease